VPLKQPQTLPKSEQQRLAKLTEFETKARAEGYQRIVGVDEVGRGSLAGPVVAAACSILEGLFFPGINDSKLLLPKKRKVLFSQLSQHPGVCYGIGIVDHTVIDQINILQATLEAMRAAVRQLPLQPDYLLVDGIHSFMEEIYSEPIIKGDSRSQTIAAASILAKETRDAIMVEYHQLYPQYNFDENKGYATETHRKALSLYGPCPIHRLTFRVSSS
jgi:ribonuclease HII